MRIAFLTLYFSSFLVSFLLAGVPVRQTERSWVDSVYRNMSDQQRIGQLINLKIDVTEERPDRYREMIGKYAIGQLFLAGGSPGACAAMLNEAEGSSGIPLLITAGGHRGIGLPLDSSFCFPGTATLNLLDDSQLTRELAGEVAVQMKMLGVRNYHTGLLNMDVSAFGMVARGGLLSDYGEIADWSPAFHRRVTDSGLFIQADLRILGSGSPDVIADNLRGLPAFSEISMKRSLMTKDFDRWGFSITQIPFFNAADAGLVERKLMNGIIRKQLGNKAIISADLDALALNSGWKETCGSALTLLLAGADVVLVSGNPECISIRLQQAVADQVIKPRDLEAKVKRVLRTKYIARLDKPLRIDTDHLTESVNRPEAKLVSYKIFRQAAGMQRGRLSRLPVEELDGRYFASLSFGKQNPEEFQEALSSYAPFVHFAIPSLSCDPGIIDKISMRLKTFDHVVIGLFAGDFVELGQDIVEFVNELSLRTRVAIVFFKDIANEDDFSDRCGKVFVREDHPFTRSIAVQMIFGSFNPDSTGGIYKRPVYRLGAGLPEEEQMDSRTLNRIDRIVREAIHQKDMPGCQVLVARKGRVLYNRSFGNYTYDSTKRVSGYTMYDLASITKVAATTQMVMWLSGNGYIDIDKPVGYYLHELENTNKEGLIICDILAHQAGLKPFYPFYRYTVLNDEPDTVYYHKIPRTPGDLEIIPGLYADQSLSDSLWRWTIETELLRKNKNGTYDYQYSDLGFYILQQLVERVSGKSLDVLADSLFYRPMGLSAMSFRPLCRFPRERMVPTERDDYFRQDLVWGTVHDPVAAMGGGVAGHAGLFSNAVDLAALMQMILNRGSYGGRQYLKGDVIDEFTSRQNENNRRSLGWDKPEPEKGYNPASRYASWETFGHRGFTGTAVWVDPTFQLIYVFLSNRVYHDRKRKKKKELNVRKRIHDVIYESMWNYDKVHVQ